MPEVAEVTGREATEVSPPLLFMFWIMSLTELFRPTPAEPGTSSFWSAGASLTTEVSSPDFRSTPTIDHGLGFGRGFGFGGQTTPTGGSAVRGFGSGEAPAPAESPEVNFEALSPTIEPLSSSLGPGSLNLFPGLVSDVGEVRLAPNPVDLSRAGSFRFAGSEGGEEEEAEQSISLVRNLQGLRYAHLRSEATEGCAPKLLFERPFMLCYLLPPFRNNVSTQLITGKRLSSKPGQNKPAKNPTSYRFEVQLWL